MSSLPLPLSPAIGATLRAVCDTRAIGGVAAAPVCSLTVLRLTRCQVVARNEWSNLMRFDRSTGRAIGTDRLTPTYLAP